MPGTSAQWLPAEPGTYEHLRPAATRVVVEPGPAPDPAAVAALGLPHLARVLQGILACIDERLAFLEQRADIGKLPMPLDCTDDSAAERYLALYSLLRADSERARSETGADPERGQSDAA